MISSINSTTGSSSYITQMQEKLFKALDTSGDGKIDKTELAAAKEKSSSGSAGGSSVDDLISSLDTDDDAAISQLEFESGTVPTPAANAENQDGEGILIRQRRGNVQ